MSERMQMLEDMLVQLTKYTSTEPRRPALMDLWVYDLLINMHASDYDNGMEIPDFIWHKTPDVIMEEIIADGQVFDLEYGWDALDEEVRDYLIINDFITDPIEVSDEEDTTKTEGK